MRRTAPSFKMPPKIYLHFAILTVVITFCLAMFADGENREAIAEAIEKQQDQAELAKLEKETLGNPGGAGLKTEINNKAVMGSWGEDNSASVPPDFYVAAYRPRIRRGSQTTKMPMPVARPGALPVIPKQSRHPAPTEGSSDGQLVDATPGFNGGESSLNLDSIDPEALERMLEKSRQRSGAPDAEEG